MLNFKGKVAIAAMLGATLSSVVSSSAMEQQAIEQNDYYKDRVVICGGEKGRPVDSIISDTFDLLYPEDDEIFYHNIGEEYSFKTPEEARKSCFDNFRYQLMNGNGSFIALHFNPWLDYCLSYNTSGTNMNNVIIGRIDKTYCNPTEVINKIIPVLQEKYNSIRVGRDMCGDEQAFLNLGFKINYIILDDGTKSQDNVLVWNKEEK